MAKRTFCDRCGVEIIGQPPVVVLTNDMAGAWQEDLCGDCAAALVIFIRGTTTSKHELAERNG